MCLLILVCCFFTLLPLVAFENASNREAEVLVTTLWLAPKLMQRSQTKTIIKSVNGVLYSISQTDFKNHYYDKWQGPHRENLPFDGDT